METERSSYARWRELHAERFPPHPEDLADPLEEHDPLCVLRDEPWTAECIGCQLVGLRSDNTYEDGGLRSAARDSLHELLEMVRGHMLDAEEFGTGSRG